ncbi:molybdenum cofactor guanylyltransferase MobA [Salmonella enterica subsp. enterica serovar Enteritidis]|nr:molybdenum cofactor guanylyltransferase MobA [Salmonella enterica subsp. enterica serovar Enteritidis]
MDVAALILAGGQSTRMGGGDKPLLELDGRPIIAHVIERLAPQATYMAINANGDGSRYAPFGLPVISDHLPDFPGPLAGVQAGLTWAAKRGANALLTIAADTPFFPQDLTARMVAAADANIVVASSAGRMHPTFALWPLGAAEQLDAYLATGERRVLGFIEQGPHCAVDFPVEPIDPFFNINRPEDLAEARRLVETVMP